MARFRRGHGAHGPGFDVLVAGLAAHILRGYAGGLLCGVHLRRVHVVWATALEKSEDGLTQRGETA